MRQRQRIGGGWSTPFGLPAAVSLKGRQMYFFWRWIAPKLPTRRLRDWAWDHKWALWHELYGAHQSLWVSE
jgi:hypothetical protein